MEEFKRQCQTNNLVNMLSKEVLMANMSQSMEYVTVFAQKELLRRIVRVKTLWLWSSSLS